METQLIIDNQALPASGNAIYVRHHPTTDLAARLNSDLQRWRGVVKQIGFTAQS